MAGADYQTDSSSFRLPLQLNGAMPLSSNPWCEQKCHFPLPVLALPMNTAHKPSAMLFPQPRAEYRFSGRRWEHAEDSTAASSLGSLINTQWNKLP